MTESSGVDVQEKPVQKAATPSMTIYFVVVAFLVFADQLTKILVKGFNIFGFQHEGMWLGQSFPFIGDIVRITFVENPGMAFGIQFGFGKIFLTLFSLIAGSALLWYLSKLGNFKTSVKIGITLLIAGALGNFIDRCFYGVLYGEQSLFFGYVVDFIQVDIPDINWFGATYTHWPVFNIADSCVSCGMVLLLFVNKYLPSLSELKGDIAAPDKDANVTVVPSDKNRTMSAEENENNDDIHKA